MNVFGNTVSSLGQVIHPYFNPMNFVERPNRYVWLLFEQSDYVNISSSDLTACMIGGTHNLSRPASSCGCVSICMSMRTCLYVSVCKGVCVRVCVRVKVVQLGARCELLCRDQ